MSDEPTGTDFIRSRVRSDLEQRRVAPGDVVTRFPPEPNGYLHIGHAKAICLNFGIAEEFGGRCYLRFDDTNPLREEEEYVEAIKHDVHWLGFDWGDRLTHASDYFEQLYGYAVKLVEAGKAYVCSLSSEEIRASRGTLTEPGTDSPYRNRGASENLELFRRMRDGEFADGEHVLRAKIDMASPNVNLRDPVLYRIRHARHQRTGDTWCVYPMYDYAHCISDALEGVTHSLCTLEYEDHRPLYEWVLDQLDLNAQPKQIEFSRLGLEYTVMSKRLLNTLVTQGHVDGWDDPRLPTLAGLRRRGVPPAAIRDFCGRIGVTKQDNLIEVELLDFCIRKELEVSAPRAMGVLDPLKVVITNYERDGEMLSAPWHPQREDMGAREMPFGAEIYIEREDFAERPPKKYKRLSPGADVRLRYAYIIRCDDVLEDADGRVTELRCSYYPASKSGSDASGIKPKGVIHWVSARHGMETPVHLYDRLLTVPNPGKQPFESVLNPSSLTVVNAVIEPAVAAHGAEHFQFERQGYFVRDGKRFNRVVTLRDSWAKHRV